MLADEAGLSTFHFAKMFKASFGVPPHRYVTERRIARAKALLAEGRTSLAGIALACGFASQSHFTRRFAQCDRPHAGGVAGGCVSPCGCCPRVTPPACRLASR